MYIHFYYDYDESRKLENSGSTGHKLLQVPIEASNKREAIIKALELVDNIDDIDKIEVICE